MDTIQKEFDVSIVEALMDELLENVYSKEEAELELSSMGLGEEYLKLFFMEVKIVINPIKEESENFFIKLTGLKDIKVQKNKN